MFQRLASDIGTDVIEIYDEWKSRIDRDLLWAKWFDRVASYTRKLQIVLATKSLLWFRASWDKMERQII